jgi:hypothetical protein
MSTTKAVTANSVKNDGGTVVAAGTLSDSPMTKVINVNELATGSEYGSKVLENDGSGGEFTDPQGVIKAKTGGTFAYTPGKGENFLVMAGGDTNAGKINNTTSSVLTVPGGVSNAKVNQINKLLTTRKLGVTSYNIFAVPSSGIVPGRTKGAGAGDVVAYVSTSGNFPAIDDAASPTRSVPGELTYHFGKIAQPYNDVYKAKDTAES